MGEVAIIGVDLAIRLFRYRSRLNRISNETLTWLHQFNDLVYGEMENVRSRSCPLRQLLL